MKIKLELHDSRKERPEKSCEVLVVNYCEEIEEAYSINKVNYSKVHDQFCKHDTSEKDDEPYCETEGFHMLWSYFDDVQKAIKDAEKPAETCFERLLRESPEYNTQPIMLCPHQRGYANLPYDCSALTCKQCWDRPAVGMKAEKDGGK